MASVILRNEGRVVGTYGLAICHRMTTFFNLGTRLTSWSGAPVWGTYCVYLRALASYLRQGTKTCGRTLRSWRSKPFAELRGPSVTVKKRTSIPRSLPMMQGHGGRSWPGSTECFGDDGYGGEFGEFVKCSEPGCPAAESLTQSMGEG